MDIKNINVSDIVYLKSGSPPLTVYAKNNGQVGVVWMNGNQVLSTWFWPSMLIN